MACWRQRGRPAAGAFGAIAGVAGGLALALAASVALAAPHAVTLGTAVVAGLVLPVPWALFAFEYTGRDELFSFSTVLAAAAPPCLGVLATATVFGAQLAPGSGCPRGRPPRASSRSG